MYALLPSLLAGLATALGCLIVILARPPGRRALAVILGGAAGVMLAVVLLDLIPAALNTGTPLETIFGIAAGIALLWVVDFLFTNRPTASSLHRGAAMRQMGYMMAIGISLHDLPEGIAIAGAYAVGGGLGPLIALSIALHNIPEGIATAAPLLMGGLRPVHILLTVSVVSLFTPLGTLIGIFLIQLSPGHLSFLLALAAGAMIYLIKDELLPSAQDQSMFWSWFGVAAGYFILWFALHLAG
ncbi:MAG: ZIP family metal transporter [Syntrophaceticus sp.]|nr:ZIP family metal transporter [Syntrophaceticus sp.]MDD3314164.1 ZIP family metal transporter [Syntrophaceticus sp.]MDD4359437.1 ZIP family metal transporter [Syntrophaceticus sp.]MDD4783859.1 ZIP family metal transporter [Syntrophaceticus sp.]HBG23307.1 ZIP family metal transporter [Peptococcaceae bacterium]